MVRFIWFYFGWMQMKQTWLLEDKTGGHTPTNQKTSHTRTNFVFFFGQQPSEWNRAKMQCWNSLVYCRLFFFFAHTTPEHILWMYECMNNDNFGKYSHGMIDVLLKPNENNEDHHAHSHVILFQIHTRTHTHRFWYRGPLIE